MSTLTRTAFSAQYVDNTTGTFADNTSQAIGANDMRQFAEDIKDSCAFTSGLEWSIIQIGDWNMDSTSSVTIAHGLLYSTIRVVDVYIFPDSGAGADYGPLARFNTGAGTLEGGVSNITSTNIVLARVSGGYFDNANFDATSYNRGYITIGYAF